MQCLSMECCWLSMISGTRSFPAVGSRFRSLTRTFPSHTMTSKSTHGVHVHPFSFSTHTVDVSKDRFTESGYMTLSRSLMQSPRSVQDKVITSSTYRFDCVVKWSSSNVRRMFLHLSDAWKWLVVSSGRLVVGSDKSYAASAMAQVAWTQAEPSGPPTGTPPD